MRNLHQKCRKPQRAKLSEITHFLEVPCQQPYQWGAGCPKQWVPGDTGRSACSQPVLLPEHHFTVFSRYPSAGTSLGFTSFFFFFCNQNTKSLFLIEFGRWEGAWKPVPPVPGCFLQRCAHPTEAATAKSLLPKRPLAVTILPLREEIPCPRQHVLRLLAQCFLMLPLKHFFSLFLQPFPL